MGAQTPTYGSSESQETKDAKLKELILYVCEKCKDDPSFDEEKLEAILFFSDFEAYRRFGESITGQTYVEEATKPKAWTDCDSCGAGILRGDDYTPRHGKIYCTACTPVVTQKPEEPCASDGWKAPELEPAPQGPLCDRCHKYVPENTNYMYRDGEYRCQECRGPDGTVDTWDELDPVVACVTCTRPIQPGDLRTHYKGDQYCQQCCCADCHGVLVQGDYGTWYGKRYCSGCLPGAKRDNPDPAAATAWCARCKKDVSKGDVHTVNDGQQYYCADCGPPPHEPLALTEQPHYTAGIEIGGPTPLQMAQNTATKHDFAKPCYDLIPPEALEAIAEVLTYGANKYEPRGWEKGARWGRYFAACMRHLWAWWRGERDDPESGLPHLAHAACCVMFLVVYEMRGVGEDDRQGR